MIIRCRLQSLHQWLFWQKGRTGSFLNDKRIRQPEKVINSCTVTGFPYTYLDMENGPLQVFERFVPKGTCAKVGKRRDRSLLVAAGRFDGFEDTVWPTGHSRRIPDRGRPAERSPTWKVTRYSPTSGSLLPPTD